MGISTGVLRHSPMLPMHMMIVGSILASSCTLIFAYGEREQNYFFSAPAQNPYLRMVITVCPVPKTLSRAEDLGDQSFAVLFSWPCKKILFTEIDEIRQLGGFLKFTLTSATWRTCSALRDLHRTSRRSVRTVRPFLLLAGAFQESEKLLGNLRQPKQMTCMANSWSIYRAST